MKSVRILSVDGGGLRGVIPALLLAELEKRSGRPCAGLFDLMAGTSAGAIVTLGLAVPGPDGAPRHSATSLAGYYAGAAQAIFPLHLRRRNRGLDGGEGELYPPDGFNAFLQKGFGDARLSGALAEVLIGSFDLEARAGHFFKRHQARRDPACDYRLTDVVWASCAAPTFFLPACVAPVGGGPSRAMIDGSVFVNNPAMCAWAEARRLWPEAERVTLVSLGTGRVTKPLRREYAREWGTSAWARPLLGIVCDGAGDTVDYQLRQLLGGPGGGDRSYWRFQVDLHGDLEKIDNSHDESLQAVQALAGELVRERSADLDALAARLAGD